MRLFNSQVRSHSWIIEFTDLQLQDWQALIGLIVAALLRELLEEVVAAGDADLAQGEVLERGEHELFHVPFVELPGALGEPLLEVEILEPVLHQISEGAVGAEPRAGGLEERAVDELGFQGSFGGGTGRAGCLHEPVLAVPVPVAGAGDDTTAVRALEPDLAVGADGQARA